MKYKPNRSRTWLSAVGTMFVRLRAVWVLAAMFVALSLFAGSSVAQKSALPPNSDPSRKLAYSLQANLRNDAGQDISRLYKQYTIELAVDCSQDALRAYMAQLAANGRIKQAPLQMENQIAILVEEATVHDMMAAPCVQEIVPGWRLSASPRMDMLDLTETGVPEIPVQTAAAAGTGGISGTVTAETSGASLSGILVCADYDNGSYWESAGCTATDVNGVYEISGLAAGLHRVLFVDNGGDYAWEFYDNVQDEDAAAPIVVVDGSVTPGINASLAERGHISGTVTAETGNVPLSDIYVCAYLGGQTGGWQGWIGCEYSDAQGQYDIGYLPGGIYRVEFYDPTGIHLREFYNNAADIDSGTDVIVTAGSTTSGINAALSNAGHITGTVSADFDGAPLEF